MDYKRAEIAGRLTKKPELKQLTNGTYVCAFTIAVNENRNGESVPEFCECVAFGKTAENISQYFDKGKSIFVECKQGWRTRKWTTKEGYDRYKTEFVVTDFHFVEPRNAVEDPLASPDAQTPAEAKYASPAPRFEDVGDADLPF